MPQQISASVQVAGAARTSLAFRVGAVDTFGRRVASDPQVTRRPLLSAAGIGVMSMMLLAGACSAGAPVSNDSDCRFQALAEVESGCRDDVRGPDGEVSRYQITASVLAEFKIKNVKLENPATALNVAKVVMAARVAVFTRNSHRAPSDFEWYLLWHRPAIYLAARHRRPTTIEKARAERFVNVLDNIQH